MSDKIDIEIPFGKRMSNIKIPKDNYFESLEMKATKKIENVEEAVKYSLDNPIGSKKIEEITKGKKSASIIISDITREVPNKQILNQILEKLEKSGIQKKDIKIIIATGSHRHNTREEQIKMISIDIVDQYNISNHDCFNEKLNIKIGKTKNGEIAKINKNFIESDVRILTGNIQPHQWAGFSGGYKAICPGIASFNTIMLTHKPEILGDELTTSGVIKGNKFYEKTIEIGELAKPDFICNAIVDKQKNPIAFFSGAPKETHRVGSRYCNDIVKLNYTDFADIVIADGGGYPSDLSLYQIVKAMHHAVKILKNNGTLILAAECMEGIGSESFKKQLFDIKDKDIYLKNLYKRKKYELDQWQLQEIINAVNKGRLLIYCKGIEDKDFPFNLFGRIKNIEEGIRIGLERTGPNSKISIIKDCPFVIPEVEK